MKETKHVTPYGVKFSYVTQNESSLDLSLKILRQKDKRLHRKVPISPKHMVMLDNFQNILKKLNQ